MSHILALVVALGSFGLYMSAFFLPEVYRKNDLIWSGVGMFYALVLWVHAGRITGGVLLGQMASVALLGWMGWQLLESRRLLTPYDQQTRLPGSSRNLGDLLKLASEELPGRVQTQFKALPQQTTGWVNQVTGRIGKSPKLSSKTVRSLPKATSKPPTVQSPAAPPADSATPVSAPPRKSPSRSPQAVVPDPAVPNPAVPNPAVPNPAVPNLENAAPATPGLSVEQAAVSPVSEESTISAAPPAPETQQEQREEAGEMAARSPIFPITEPILSPLIGDNSSVESPVESSTAPAESADPTVEQAATVAKSAGAWVDLATPNSATPITNAETDRPADSSDEAIIELATSTALQSSNIQPTAPEPKEATPIQDFSEAPAAWFELATDATPAASAAAVPPAVNLAEPARSLNVQPLPAEPESEWEFDWEPPTSEYVSPDSASDSANSPEEGAIAPDWQDDFEEEELFDQPTVASEEALENAVIVSIERLDLPPATLPLVPEAAPPLHQPAESTEDLEPTQTEPFFGDEEFEYEDWECEPPLAD